MNTNVNDTVVSTVEEQIEALKNQIKALKKESKEQKRSTTAKLVRFKNQKGETIEGYGELYYVVSMNGKLYYKRDNACEILD